MRAYLTFIAANPRFLTFGLLCAFFSSFGQTFFIALFGGLWREEFGLTHGVYGGLYSLATLASGLLLIWLGGKIDRIDLPRYTLLVSGGLIAACLLTAAAPTVWILPLAFFALRLTGQGLMSHVSTVAMARYFDAARGKAISVAALGYPIGEAVLPVAAVAMAGALGWRATWLTIGLLLLIGLAPLMLWLLRGHGERETARLKRAANSTRPGDDRSRSLGQVLRDPVFYPVMLAMMAPAFINTGFFFHQVHLAETKGWSLEWLASCFVGFAAAQVVAGLVAGSLADRFGTIRMLPFYLPMLGLGAACVAIIDHPVGALLYLGLFGLTAGANFTMLGAVWAELYGTSHLGAIRSLVQASMVVSTSASPVIFGALLDQGIGFATLAWGCAGYVVIAVVTLTALQTPLHRRAAALQPIN